MLGDNTSGGTDVHSTTDYVPLYSRLHLNYAKNIYIFIVFLYIFIYECRTESHEQLFFACELGTADDGECGGRWNQLLCYP